MTPERPSPPPSSRPEHSEPWRVERMIQRVPAHLGETTRDNVSPWVMLAAVALLLVIVCAVLFILLGGASGFGFGGSASTTTPTRPPRSVTPAVTILPITLAAPTSPTPGPTAATVKYKVKAGDTLSAIAARYRVSIQAIMTANGLKDDNIRVGEELIIPLPTPTPQPGSNLHPPPLTTPTLLVLDSPPTSASSAATPGVIRHIVKRGDTLIGIAASYASSVEAIRLANRLESDFLSIGQELLVPVGAWTPTAVTAPMANATATPTAQFAYAAPNLLWPPDNHTLRGSQDLPILSWASPATLKADEFYVVHVEYVSGSERKVLPALTVRQGTSVRLDPAVYYPGANPNGTQFSWYVVIVSQAAGPRAPEQSPQVFAQSPTSSTRTFTWY